MFSPARARFRWAPAMGHSTPTVPRSCLAFGHGHTAVDLGALRRPVDNFDRAAKSGIGRISDLLFSYLAVAVLHSFRYRAVTKAGIADWSQVVSLLVK